VTQQIDVTFFWIKMLLAGALHWLIFHVAFLVIAKAWPSLNPPLLKGKKSKVSLNIHPGKANTASNTKFLAANRRFAIAPGGRNVH